MVDKHPTSEQHLLKRIVENGDPRKLLDAIFAGIPNFALGEGELDQGELDLLAELRTVKPKMVYDLEDMKFVLKSKNIYQMFLWYKTPEGTAYWEGQCLDPTQEGHDKIQAMQDQWKKEKSDD